MLRRGSAPFGFRGPKDSRMQGARSSGSEAYSLYAAANQSERNAADGRHAALGLAGCPGKGNEQQAGEQRVVLFELVWKRFTVSPLTRETLRQEQEDGRW